MIDTHCHLTFPDFQAPTGDPLDGVKAELAECARLGVTGCVTISTTTSDCLDALAIAKRFDNVWCTSGVHPLYSAATSDRPRAEPVHVWGNLRTVALDPRCVAWGELGLDNHYPDPPPAAQRVVLDEQLAFIERVHAEEVAKWQSAKVAKPTSTPPLGHFATPPLCRFPLPIVLHCREAFDDLIPVLRATGLDPTKMVFHCFTGTPADARKILDFGAMMSFTGVVTYLNARELRDAAKLVPADRFMVETDAPFLAPAPHRGKRPCRPAWTRHVLEGLATLRNDDFDALHERVNENTRRFFGIA
jgi:TatD DNase family protein